MTSAAIPRAEAVYMGFVRAIVVGALATAISYGLDRFGGPPFDYWTVFSFSAGGFWLGARWPRWPNDGGT